MVDGTRVSTEGTPASQRSELVREAAFRLFNLEVEFGEPPPEGVSADLRIARTPHAGIVDVRTSWSLVQRTPQRARAAEGGNFLVYYIRQGGSRFENARGEQFRTTAGSVVIGSQDAPYKAVAAEGKEWAFDVVSIAPELFDASGDLIRARGFQLLPAQSPLHPLVSTYLASLTLELPTLDATSAAASLRALDQLIAGAMASSSRMEPQLVAPAVSVQRHRLAMAYIDAHFADASLAPGPIAAHLCISPRQLHRLFEACGTSVSREIRSARVRKAKDLIRLRPDLPLTHVAFECGFDSLATFYRSFRADAGMTASEWRRGEGA